MDRKRRLVLSPRLKAELAQRAVAESFAAYEGEAELAAGFEIGGHVGECAGGWVKLKLPDG